MLPCGDFSYKQHHSQKHYCQNKTLRGGRGAQQDNRGTIGLLLSLGTFGSFLCSGGGNVHGDAEKYGVPALIVATLIAFSRLYVGVHYPFDVIAGVLTGTIYAVINSGNIQKNSSRTRTIFEK